MKTRIHFAHRIDRLEEADELLEHLAGVASFKLAEATYRVAVKPGPAEAIIQRVQPFGTNFGSSSCALASAAWRAALLR